MHPAAALLLWLTAVLCLQFYSPLIMSLLLFPLVLVVPRPWLRMLWRARWLFLSLWLIMAYSQPGHAVFEHEWLPTWEGVDAANLHALRLALLLGALAVLLNALSRDHLLQALWCLLRPLGGTAERLVVRLGLIFARLEKPRDWREWRQLLASPMATDIGEERIRL